MPTSLRGVLGRGSLQICVGSGEAWGALRNTVGMRVDPTTGCSEGLSWQVVMVILTRVRKSKGQSRTLDACDRFLHSHPYNQGFLFFLFALGNTTESDEEFGKRVWVPCAESSDEICEQGKNTGIWL